MSRLPNHRVRWLDASQYEIVTDFVTSFLDRDHPIPASEVQRTVAEYLVARVAATLNGHTVVTGKALQTALQCEAHETAIQSWMPAVKNALAVLHYANVVFYDKGTYRLGAQWDHRMLCENMARLRRPNLKTMWYMLPPPPVKARRRVADVHLPV